jgi:hypothetical protein
LGALVASAPRKLRKFFLALPGTGFRRGVDRLLNQPLGVLFQPNANRASIARLSSTLIIVTVLQYRNGSGNLFVAEGFHGVEVGGAEGGQHSAYQTDDYQDYGGYQDSAGGNQ